MKIEISVFYQRKELHMRYLLPFAIAAIFLVVLLSGCDQQPQPKSWPISFSPVVEQKGEVIVPNFVGKSGEEAQLTAESCQLVIGQCFRWSTSQKGESCRVISQSPDSGTKVPKGFDVQLVYGVWTGETPTK